MRRNAASPAPSSTPSSAKTTPATGTTATRNHHASGTCASTAGSGVNTRGSTLCTARSPSAIAAANPVDHHVTRQASARACAVRPAPSAAPTSACAATARESRTSEVKVHSCSTTWCAATAAAPERAATAAAERKQAWKARLRSTRSRPSTSCARIFPGSGRTETAPVRRSVASALRNSPAESTWPSTLATAEPLRPQPAPCTSTGHTTADTPLPTSTYRSGRTVSCTPRSQPFPAKVTSISGMPSEAIRSHPCACAASSPPPASTRVTGAAASCTRASSTSPRPPASQVACTPSTTASERRPAPCSRAARAVVP